MSAWELFRAVGVILLLLSTWGFVAFFRDQRRERRGNLRWRGF